MYQELEAEKRHNEDQSLMDTQNKRQIEDLIDYKQSLLEEESLRNEIDKVIYSEPHSNLTFLSFPILCFVLHILQCITLKKVCASCQEALSRSTPNPPEVWNNSCVTVIIGAARSFQMHQHLHPLHFIN